MKKFAMTFLCVFSMMFITPAAQAAFQLPNYAQGQADLKVQAEQKGKKVTDLIIYISGILGIITISIGGAFIASAQGEKGKWFVISGVIGIMIAASVFGIAGLGA